MEGLDTVKPLKTLLGGAMLLEYPRFEDERGSFSVHYQAEAADQAGLPRFVQDNHSVSRPAGTLRGLHLQLAPWAQGKLIRIGQGRVFDVFVDLRPGSDTHGRWESVELGAEDDRQLWVPPGFAHGFCTLEPDTEVFYKVDAPYRPEAEWTLAWDDPTLAIDWPPEASDPILSDKDRAAHTLAETTAAIEAAARDTAAIEAAIGDGGDR